MIYRTLTEEEKDTLVDEYVKKLGLKRKKGESTEALTERAKAQAKRIHEAREQREKESL